MSFFSSSLPLSLSLFLSLPLRKIGLGWRITNMSSALLPNRPIDNPVQTPMFIIDWEVLSLGEPLRDVAQMMAELAMLQLFKDITAGDWLVEGFLEGYGTFTRDEALRIAIHVGCHLVVIGGSVAGWGSPADIERVVTYGRDAMIKGWEKDAAWFEGSILGRLF